MKISATSKTCDKSDRSEGLPGHPIVPVYLHREIREKGGTYGGFAIHSPEDGIFCFGSYRNPHIVSTLNVYNGARNFIRSGNFNNEDIKEAVLQVCSEIDKPDPPGPAVKKGFF